MEIKEIDIPWPEFKVKKIIKCFLPNLVKILFEMIKKNNVYSLNLEIKI